MLSTNVSLRSVMNARKASSSGGRAFYNAICQIFRHGSHSAQKSQEAVGVAEIINGVSMPPEPTHCCNSGCANCVWIKYAQEVTQLFENGDVIAKNKIMEKVKDPNMRAFIFTQLGISEETKS